MDDQPRSDEPLVIDVIQDGGVTTVRPSGEVDMATARVLEDALLTEVRAQPVILIVDLEAVRFLASMGLSVLARADQAARDGGIETRIVATSPIVVRTLELTGLVEELTVFGSYAEALAGKKTPPIRTQ